MIVDSLRELLEAMSYCEKALWHFTALLLTQNIYCVDCISNIDVGIITCCTRLVVLALQHVQSFHYIS